MARYNRWISIKGKWLVVNYWATWCSTCMKEMPELISFHENNKNSDVVVVGISFESIERNNLKEFVSEKPIPYTVLNTEPVRVIPLGKVPALPATYVFSSLRKSLLAAYKYFIGFHYAM